MLNYSRWHSLDPVWRTLFLSSTLGFLFGAFIRPGWTEAVEFGQVIGNAVQYPLNDPWYYEIVHNFSLFTLIPAFLTKAGVNLWLQSLLFTGILGALSVSCVALASLVLCGMPLLSVLMALLLFNYQFAVFHYYPIFYPVQEICFGQVGLYLTLFIFSLFALKKTKWAIFLLGFMPAWHVGWAIPSWFAGAVVFWVLRKKIDVRRHLMLFIAGALLVLCALGTQKTVFPSHTVSESTPFDRDRQLREMKISREIVAQRDENGNPSSHNMVIREAKQPLREAVAYFSSEIYFLFLALLIWRLTPSYWTSERRLLIIGLWTICGLSLAIRALDEMDKNFTWITPLDPYLPYYIQRIIAGRWLNLNMILAPLLLLSNLAVLSFEKKSPWANALLGIVAGLAIFRTNWALIPPFSRDWSAWWRLESVIPFLFISVLLLERYLPNLRFSRWENRVPRVSRYALSLGIFWASFCVMSFPTLAAALKEKPFLGHDDLDELCEVAAKTPGVIILAVGIKLRNGFNPQVRTRRPIELPGPLSILGPSAEVANVAKMNIDVYCLDVFNFDYPFHTTEQIKACFEARDTAAWQRVGKEYSATSVLTLNTWKLNLPAEATAGGLTLYRIPPAD